MSRYGYFLWIIFLALAASITLACGNGPQRQIVSLSVSPSPADGPQAQFTATGTYTTHPVMVSPLQGNWSVLDNNGHPTTEVSINTNGLAQCASGASGIFTVGAWVLLLPSPPPQGTCNVIGPFGDPCGSVLGTAQLTCP
jgi:hypothetical protein